MLPEPVAVTLLVANALETLGVPYFIGGSMATALHGVSRATMDVDMVADMRPEHVDPFVQLLKGAFYVDDEMILGAIRHRSSFNVIHLETAFKVDVFIAKSRSFDEAQFERRQLQVLGNEPDQTAYVASPEDNILAKLEWYRMGGEVSERQWRDILNVMRVQGERLDRAYLHQWAARLGVSDLLARALVEAEGS